MLMTLSATGRTLFDPASMQNLQTVYDKLRPLLNGHDPEHRLADRLGELHHHLHTRAVRSVGSRRDLLNGYSYDVFYDWDAYFENCYLSHLGEPRFCRSTTEAFLDQQLENGFVSRSLGLPRLRQHFKPFLAQMVWLGVRQGVDPVWLRGRYWERLVKYVDHWTWFRDHDRNGLSVWDSADHTGMDNQDRRAGAMHSDTVEGVDLNVYLARELDSLALLADRLDLAGDAEGFRADAAARRDAINEHLWDEQSGFYLDRHERTGELQHAFSVAGFLPLWDGTATPERAERLVREHLTNEETFWLPHPVATWSKQEPDYYQMRADHECTWLRLVLDPDELHGLPRPPPLRLRRHRRRPRLPHLRHGAERGDDAGVLQRRDRHGPGPRSVLGLVLARVHDAAGVRGRRRPDDAGPGRPAPPAARRAARPGEPGASPGGDAGPPRQHLTRGADGPRQP